MKTKSQNCIRNLTIISLCLIGSANADRPDHHWFQSNRTIVIDVACDGRTFVAIGLVDVATDGEEPDFQIARGTSFIVNGKIYLGGTIPPGNGFDIDSEEGRVGTWVCRGTFNLGVDEIMAGQVPHVSTTQQYLFGKGGTTERKHSMASEGQEGGITSNRIVLGGTGWFRGMVGEVRQESLGTNSTGLENFRFTFKIRR